MLVITKRFRFCAAHRYHNAEWSEEQNRTIFGADHRIHGHNYDLEVSLSGPVDPATGFIADLQKVKEIVETRVIDQLDHAQIDVDIPWFKERQPSSENLVLYIWEQLVSAFPADVQLVRIRLYETPTIYAEYSGE